VWENVNKAFNIPGWMDRREIHWLAYQAKNCDLVIEIGTWLGRSAYAMGQKVRGRVITIDNFEPMSNGRAQRKQVRAYRTHGLPGFVGLNTYSEWLHNQCLTNLKELIDREKVEVINGNSNEVINDLVGLSGKVDMVFIDGSHDAKSIKSDILNYKRLLKWGGLLCGHDYANEVKEVVSELLPNAKKTISSIWSCRY
jgi:predicted O-methyltransferase YrrM